jgi:cytochrome c oxidase subunit III
MAHDHAADHGHDHPSFLAHHFDDPEQQFDSGKLGIWLFLVTEVLFFSGMFCAYALFRARNPEIFTFASQFLNTSLGAFNTGVLLFSSLTMAWGVRCAQLRQRGGLVLCLAITLCCASMFLGVKAVEYTHKWDLGLLPASLYQPQHLQTHGHHEAWQPLSALTGQVPMDYLTALCIVPGLIVLGLGIWTAKVFVTGDRRIKEVASSLFVTSICFFVGVGIGKLFESAEASSHHADSHHSDSNDAGHHNSEQHHSDDHSGDHANLEMNHSGKGLMADAATSVRFVAEVDEAATPAPGDPTINMVDQKGGAGLFFSVYYCMTGVHAIHIIGGMLVLGWLLIRASKDVFNEQYFGPVDYVGLYWHLVDLIWIYLFPLLYLIR